MHPRRIGRGQLSTSRHFSLFATPPRNEQQTANSTIDDLSAPSPSLSVMERKRALHDSNGECVSSVRPRVLFSSQRDNTIPLEDLPSDTEARAGYYRQRFRDEILLNCSPVVHISHLLCAIPGRKQVEDEIRDLVVRGIVREVPFSSCGSHGLLVFVEDIKKDVSRCKTRIESSGSLDKSKQLCYLDTFQNKVLARFQESILTRVTAMKLFCQCGVSDEDKEDFFRFIVGEGFMVSSGEDQVRLSVPFMGSYLVPFKSARDSILKLLQTKKFSTFNEKDLLSKKKARDLPFYRAAVQDLVGCMILKRISGPNGDMLQKISTEI